MSEEINGDKYEDYEYISISIIRAIIDGDMESIRIVTDRYTGYIWTVLRNQSRRRGLRIELLPAEDLTQSIYLKFVIDIKKFRIRGKDDNENVAMFDSYCTKILYHIIRDVLNKYMRELNEFTTVPYETLERYSTSAEYTRIEKIPLRIGDSNIWLENEKLAEAIMALRPQYRRIIELSYFLEYTDQDIAECLKIKVNTVYQYRYKALDIIKDWMRKN